MRVYEATVIDRCAGAEPISFESYVAVCTQEELNEGSERASRFLPVPYIDEDIHYYFTEDEFKPKDGEIETEEFEYLIGKRVA